MDKKAILQKIKIRRVSLGMSQDEASQKMGIDPSQYSRIETGAADITLTKFLKLLSVMNLTFADLTDMILPAATSDHENIANLRKELLELKKFVESALYVELGKKRIKKKKIGKEHHQPFLKSDKLIDN